MKSKNPINDFVNANGIRLHYLDWGGEGPVLLFLAGMGCSAYIFGEFAPRFTDKFHVVSLTRQGSGDSDYPESGYDIDTLTEDVRQFLDLLKIEQVILVGHSMAGLELTHFVELYPDRVQKLVYLDAAYNWCEDKAIKDNPLNKIKPPGPKEFHTIEEMVDHIKKIRLDLAEIWGDSFHADFMHSVKTTADGKVVDKTSAAIEQAITDTIFNYSPDFSKILIPTLSIYSIWDHYPYSLPEYFTAEQKTATIEFIDTILIPLKKKRIEQFRRDVPGATVLVIPNGHHYCFIRHEELVYDEMRKFLLVI